MLSLDSMFGLDNSNQQRTDIIRIPIIKLKPFDNQPFKLYSEKRLQELADDIKLNGLLAPIIVRPLDDGMYQILAGHNRVSACLLNNENVIDAIVKNVNDAEAELILVQSNLQQRQELSNSEKAKAYQMRHKALKKLGKVNRGKHNSLAMLADESNESQRTIARYIKTNKLSSDLMNRFDNKEFSVSTAEKLSSLSKQNQTIIDEFLEVSDKKLNAAIVEKICHLADEDKLNENKLMKLYTPRKKDVRIEDIMNDIEQFNIQIGMDELNAIIKVFQNHSLLKNKLIE